jgi:hypothetical protein
MKSKAIPTFVNNGELLTGVAARDTWADQTARCNCGSYGDTEHAIAGTCNDMPAKWLGCDNCHGSAVGRPIVFRLSSQITAKRVELSKV